MRRKSQQIAVGILIGIIVLHGLAVVVLILAGCTSESQKSQKPQRPFAHRKAEWYAEGVANGWNGNGLLGYAQHRHRQQWLAEGYRNGFLKLPSNLDSVVGCTVAVFLNN